MHCWLVTYKNRTLYFRSAFLYRLTDFMKCAVVMQSTLGKNRTKLRSKILASSEKLQFLSEDVFSRALYFIRPVDTEMKHC